MLAACATPPLPIEQLTEETAAYREYLAGRYLLLCGKSSSLGALTAPAKIQRKLGKLPGWELYYAPDDFYLLPTLVPTDDALKIGMLLEQSVAKKDELPEYMVARPLPAERQRAILESMRETVLADEATVRRETQAWLETWAFTLLAMAEVEQPHFYHFTEDHGLAVAHRWYCLSGGFKILANGNLEAELWGLIPGRGWATALFDAKTRKVTVTYDE